MFPVQIPVFIIPLVVELEGCGAKEFQGGPPDINVGKPQAVAFTLHGKKWLA